MGKAAVEIGDARGDRVAEDARALARLVDAASDFECLGAEAAAEFGR